MCVLDNLLIKASYYINGSESAFVDTTVMN